jgi:hypothetical protein
MNALPRDKTVGTVALSAFFAIAVEWKLTTREQMKLLGMASKSTFYSHKRLPNNAKINQDRLERLSCVIGIYKDLHTLLTDDSSLRAWIKKPNDAEPFCGRSALDYMIERGRILDLITVRNYLAGRRGT